MQNKVDGHIINNIKVDTVPNLTKFVILQFVLMENPAFSL